MLLSNGLIMIFSYLFVQICSCILGRDAQPLLDTPMDAPTTSRQARMLDFPTSC